MEEELTRIANRLKQQLYKNEEQIRFSLVGRILYDLGWDIWNPKEVFTEFNPPHLSDSTKVDVALFPKEHNNPSIFLEIKSPERLKSGRELSKAEDQLKNYNADLTALFTILTDGDQWIFYYSQEGGTFTEKNFKTITITKEDVNDTKGAFEMFLKKDAITSGEAKVKAYSYLQLNRKQKVMEECMPESKRILEDEPELSHVEALQKATDRKDVKVSYEEARDFIKKYNKNDLSQYLTTQVVQPETNDPKPDGSGKNSVVNFGAYPPDTLTGTTIEEGLVGKEKRKNWNPLVFSMVEQLIYQGQSPEHIAKISGLNIKNEIYSKKGFKRAGKTNCSVQHVDATKACQALVTLAQEFNIRLRVIFRWKNPLDGQDAGKRGEIQVN